MPQIKAGKVNRWKQKKKKEEYVTECGNYKLRPVKTKQGAASVLDVIWV